jgi:hypothetical protein
MGKAFSLPVGIQELAGDVRINQKKARVEDRVEPGDIVTTGPKSRTIFVIGKSVFLVRENTQIEISIDASNYFKEAVVNLLRIANGKVLSVFGHGRKRLITPTAAIGVRGSAVYIEAGHRQTYVCVCYGTADIISRGAPGIRETVKTTHHEAPRYVHGPDSNPIIVEAPVINHTDQELITLERMVWRVPPFMQENKEGNGGNGSDGGGY